MNKYEMFDALQLYKKNLSHAQSKLYGTQRDNAKYYKREGKPGAYIYYYTKEEWDKAHDPNLKAKMLMKEVTDRKKANKEVQQKEIFEKNKAAAEAREREEQSKRTALYNQNNPTKTVAQKDTEDSMKGYEDWYKEKGKRQQIQNKIKADLKNVSGKEALEKAQADIEKRETERKEAEQLKENINTIQNENKFDNANNEPTPVPNKILEEQKMEKLKNDNPVKFMKEYHAEDIKKNTEWLQTDPESELLMATDVINASLFYGVPGEYDDAIDEIYQKIEARKRTEITDTNYDSEGFGLKVKNYDLPIEEEIKLVNPGYYYSDSNLGADITKYNQNCYACTTAMALRKKGYDVTAGTDYNGAPVVTDIYGNDINATDNEIGLAYNELWTGNFTKYDTPSNTFNKMFSEPVGSYGDFNLEYTAALGGGGHSIFYEVHEDGIHFYDCQIGCEIDMNVMQYYIQEARYKRLDNQTFKGSQKMKNANKISTNKVMEEAIKK